MTSDRPAAPLLTVKQVIPPVRAGAVRRSRLEFLLRDAATPLTVVVAPAGWGKTSLLSAWASSPGERDRVAWVSLDEGDDEPRRFWNYVLTALRRISDEIGPAALDALAVGGGPVDLALPILLNELAASSTRTCWCSTTTTWSPTPVSTRRSSFSSPTFRCRCGWCWPVAPTRRCRWPGCVPAAR